MKFFGQGYGHGVGMNQYGAKGRAEDGQTAEEILRAYFHGATMSTVNPNKLVRVLLLRKHKATSAAPLVIYGRGGSWGLTGTDAVFPADAQLKLWRVSGKPWKVKVTSAGGDLLYRASVSGRPYVTALEAGTAIQLYSKPSVYDTYRGSLRLFLASTKRKVTVVNHLGLDDYLRGVAPVEMPVSWSREAVRAQVIASRSYAVKCRNPGRGKWDMTDDTRSQVYRGTKAEKGLTNALIEAEPGAVIRYKGDKVIKAFYFSTGGGATENNEYSFVSSSGTPGTSKVPYLRGIVDRSPYGIPYDKDAPLYSWKTTRLSTGTLSSMFRKDSRTNVGTLTRLDLRRRGVSGRLYQVVLYGTAGKKTVSADVFRSVYNRYKPSSARLLRSNLFDTRPIAGT